MSRIDASGDVDSAQFTLPRATILSLARVVKNTDVIHVNMRIGYVDGDRVIMATVVSEDMRGERSERRMVATASGVFDL